MLLLFSAAMTNLISVIHSDPEILGGTPVFIGTRVPVKNLLDYLAAGDPLSEFLDHFPSVRQDQAIAVLNLAKEMLTTQPLPADANIAG
jgi:uncharacterized protein (DUF433 family)